MKLEENCEPWGTDNKYLVIFSSKIEAIEFICFQVFCNVHKKCLQTAYCMQHRMFSFECFLVRLNEQRRFSFFSNNQKTLTHLELNFKWRPRGHKGLKIGQYCLDITQLKLGDIHFHAVFGPIVHKQKYLMDHKKSYLVRHSVSAYPTVSFILLDHWSVWDHQPFSSLLLFMLGLFVLLMNSFIYV